MPSPADTLARQIATTLNQNGHQAFLVGGCVRDRLLGRPVKDVDIATDAQPARLKELFPGALEVGAHFGVVLVRDGEVQVEVATFRSDHAYSDGRHPDGVTFETDPAQDAARRDFTINALFEDPFTGTIVDYIGGRADLDARIIRAIGDPAQRFAEDHLRLLRAVRFASRLDFSIERETFNAMQAAVASIRLVSAERIRDEISMILTEGRARRGVELLSESGLLAHILPEVEAMHGVPQPPQFHPEGDVWIHTMLMLAELPTGAPLELALSVLLHDVGKPPTFTITDRIRFNGHAEKGADMADEILTRLRYPRAVIDAVVSLVRNHMRFIEAPRMKISTFKRFLRLPHFDDQLELYRLDLAGSYRSMNGYEEVKARRAELSDDDLRPRPLISGNDLIALGYTPGPQFHEILTRIEDAQLDGAITSREEALRYLTSHFDRG